ncbi:binding-protein-dependent transport systems inner membrane component [Thermobaculum terrenum ATCC BAA-798]|uniref:Binding-protein-dependent transport systems inner membrane component n=1 Tax=Thermobaculum terrenum (strain ATCC BAA-798 / CCMEE 7001 / YNP1) TaxID=525904 RepID=D1CGM4_THET1|nr:carbohydrate ABC transporter permease [Thermobaculum terrenum]ACZ42895.1 binding-protein-dependent transport systems inner membrane component [Thermobaculum terrenum ATCC BAA-798]
MLAITRRISLDQILIILMLLLLLVVTAYPFLYILFISVMPYTNYMSQPFHLLPSGFTLDYYRIILATPALLHGFQISVLKTVVGTLLNVLVTMMAAWTLSRAHLPFRRSLIIFFAIPLFFGGGIIPFFLVVHALGLLDTFWALILPGLVSPFLVFLAMAYLREYPQEVVEAALVDGAGQFTVFWRIVMPTSQPIIATLAMLYGLGHWNDYFWPSVLVQDNLYPATVILRNGISGQLQLQQLGVNVSLVPQSVFSAMAVLLIVPPLLLYPFLQRYVVRGILIGSIKG